MSLDCCVTDVSGPYLPCYLTRRWAYELKALALIDNTANSRNYRAGVSNLRPSWFRSVSEADKIRTTNQRYSKSRRGSGTQSSTKNRHLSSTRSVEAAASNAC